MVGIGGGALSGKHDIRLGDVVVGCPMKKEGGMVPYNFGKAVQDREFERTIRAISSTYPFDETLLLQLY